MRHWHAGRSIHPRSGTVIKEASFSQAPSHTAPAKKSSRKSVGGNALRVLSGATQVGQRFQACPEPTGQANGNPLFFLMYVVQCTNLGCLLAWLAGPL